MRGLDSILSLIEGKKKPGKVTAVRPSKALIINAVEGVKISAIIPTNSAPSGDVPIAKVTTPNVLPRIFGSAAINTMVDCIVPKPAAPTPSAIRRISDSKYHCESAKRNNATKETIEPYKNTFP